MRRDSSPSPWPVLHETDSRLAPGASGATRQIGLVPHPYDLLTRAAATASQQRPVPRSTGRGSHLPLPGRFWPCPICSIVSSEPVRKPAVSCSTTGSPSMLRCTSTMSRVVPAIGDTMAASLRASRLRMLDLPAFGGPANTTRNPVRRRWPALPRSSSAATCASRLTARGIACATHSAETPGSSMKSIAASRRASMAMISPRQVVKGAARAAFEVMESLSPLILRSGLDQIGNPFRLHEVDLAVAEGPSRELSRVGGTHAGKRTQGGEQGLDDGAPAVDMKLRNILAGVRSGRGEPHDDSPVDRQSGRTAFELAQRCTPGRRHAAGDFFDNRPGFGSTDPYHGYAGHTGARRQCVNSIRGVHAALESFRQRINAPFATRWVRESVIPALQ